ncbi:MAG: efflux RND transporter periplasmic adaptor subunit [Nitrospira sp.]|nr:efflux RND transporter periplasmic adaptor subunit [Nitrospira sp.]
MAVVSSATRETIQAEVVEITHASVPVRVEVTGQVAASFQAALSSRIQGTIDRLFVREGTSVVKGQTLLQLDNRDVRADLARVSAEVESTKAQLARMTNLYAQDAVSKQELENATRAYKVAEAARKAVLAQLSYTIVKAPFDGVITEKMMEAGELASPGQPLVRMENPRHLQLKATVAEGDLKSVSLGDEIAVVIDALDQRALNGVVGQILPAGDSHTHTFTVKVDLPAEPGLKTGMFGRFQLDTGTSKTILVPWTAVVERGELTGVFAVGSDRIARLRWIKTGRRLGQQVEILSGVNVGESVLLDATRGIDGVAVTLVDATASPVVRTACSVSCQSPRSRVASSVFRISESRLSDVKRQASTPNSPLGTQTRATTEDP